MKLRPASQCVDGPSAWRPLFSVVFAAMIFSQPDLATGSLFWLVWAFGTLLAVLVYGIGTTAFRSTPQRQSRRMRRWLKAGTS